MPRIDPNTRAELLDAEYLNSMRNAAFELLKRGETEALGALWSVLSDLASEAFERKLKNGDALRRYHGSVYRDLRDLADEVEAAYQHTSDWVRC